MKGYLGNSDTRAFCVVTCMDMGISVVDDLNKRDRCQENIKVYTRRSRIRNLKNKSTSDAKIIVEDKNDDKSKDDHRDENNNMDVDIVTDQSIHTETLETVQEKDNCIAPDETLEIIDIEKLDPVEEDNVAVLGHSLQIKDLNLVQETEKGSSKPIITKFDGRVRISFAPAKPKKEVRQLKRKLEDELDQVRGLVQRLDAKKIQLTSYSTSNGGYNSNHSHLRSQAKDVIAQARANSVLDSVGHYDSRPFQNLSVQVFENKHDGVEFHEKEKRTPKENQYYRSSEFLLAKDRLPPESNKNMKNNGFRKHGGEMGFGFSRNKYNSKALKSCNNLITRLMRHKFAWVFNKPVDAKALGLHDYHYIIRNPMDLGTIKSKLAKNRYRSPNEFAEDVRLTFRNAMTYNPPGHDVYVMAEELWYIFEDKWEAIESEINYDLRYGLVQEMSLRSPLPRKVSPSPPSLSRMPAFETMVLDRTEMGPATIDYTPKPKAPVVRKPVPKKPKSKDPDKRDMTSDEKQKLSTQLLSLPAEKLESIVQIVNKGKGSLSQHDDEVELDVDSLNAETLWELDRLVTNYKKNLSKRKRRAEIAQARADVRPAMNNVSATSQAQKVSTKDQKNISAFPLPGEGIGNSSSSSSSSSDSDSDSDSSDSDSDSSSGYRSPAVHSPKS